MARRSKPLSGKSRVALQMISLLLFLAGWELAVRLGFTAGKTIPSPLKVLDTLQKEHASGIWWNSVQATVSHYLSGVLAGTVFGMMLGVAAALSPTVHALQEGVARIVRPIPPLAWVPFAIIWFGITESAAAFIIGVGVFWVNYFATYTAVSSMDTRLLEVCEVFGQSSPLRRLCKAVLPSATPGLLSGLRSGLGVGWFAVLAAELFGIPGIGQRMMEASGMLATDVVLLYMATIALLYSVSDGAMAWLSKRLLKWQV